MWVPQRFLWWQREVNAAVNSQLALHPPGPLLSPQPIPLPLHQPGKERQWTSGQVHVGPRVSATHHLLAQTVLPTLGGSRNVELSPLCRYRFSKNLSFLPVRWICETQRKRDRGMCQQINLIHRGSRGEKQAQDTISAAASKPIHDCCVKNLINN